MAMKSTVAFLLLLCSFCVLCAGCQPQTRAYQVSVRNDTAGPVTIWLLKEGGPYEDGWKSPEDLAIESPKANIPIGGMIVRPGKIADAGPVTGHFDPDANAVLRVYRGAHSFNELLAISSGSPDRISAKLRPGDNEFLITQQNFRISLEPVDQIPATRP